MEGIPSRQPWNKGNLTGQNQPLKLREVWAIRIRRRLENPARPQPCVHDDSLK